MVDLGKMYDGWIAKNVTLLIMDFLTYLLESQLMFPEQNVNKLTHKLSILYTMKQKPSSPGGGGDHLH